MDARSCRPDTVGMRTSLWPRVAQALRARLSGMPCSTSTNAPSVQMRGASTASCSAHAVVDQVDQRLHRRGEDLAAAGQAERIDATLPSRSAIIGDIEVVTRLPGAIDSALPGRGSKLYM